MQLPRYELRANADRLRFEFVSVGPKGSIIKRVEFTYIEALHFWNLGFGDYDPLTNHIDDTTVSDNGDGRKVLATVVNALLQFLQFRPEATVFFAGSTEQRTRVYGWAIANYWHEVSDYFAIEAVTVTGDTVPLPSAENVLGFLIMRKE